MSEPANRFSSAALQAFGDLVARRASGAVDTEEFLREHPDIASEVRDLDSLSRRVDRLLGAVEARPEYARSQMEMLGLVVEETEAAARVDLEQLEQLRNDSRRYERKEVVGSGGTSIVYRTHDRLLGRTVAMKVIRGDRGLLARFLAEARLVGRLEHPGVVPVHDVGLDADGHAFFTMPLMRGRTLAEVIRGVDVDFGEWNQSRALDVVLRICDAVAYAHSIGVVHRDLKPENVLVGHLGEVRVVDWGLAQVPGNDEPQASGIDSHDDPLTTQHTRSGAVIGTPAYMPPEQAEGQLDLIGPRSDVYGIGAILYCVLTGVAPYCDHGRKPTGSEVLAAALAGPPTDVETLVPGAPPELVAICRKAMKRAPADRYADVAAMADDLRAYQDGRVVQAHAGGAWMQLRKWVKRNRALASALGLALTLLVAGSSGLAWSENRRSSGLELAASELRFESDRSAPAALRAAADELWPALPENIGRMEAWLADARALLSRRETYVASLERLRQSSMPQDSQDPEEAQARAALDLQAAAVRSEIDGYEKDIVEMSFVAEGYGQQEGLDFAFERRNRLTRRLDRLEARRTHRLTWRFADPTNRARHAALDRLVLDLDTLADPVDGLLSDMERRLVQARSIPDDAALRVDAAWSSAIDEIADPARCPAYGGLRITPQVGLQPLRRDEHSGLYEFAQLASGDVPKLGPDGEYVIGARTCIVLVLLPPGRFRMGVRAIDPLPGECLIEGGGLAGPLRELELDPFFLSKYEMTQGQWLNVTGGNPSYFHAGTTFSQWHDRVTFTLSHPVDSMDWREATDALARIDLELPTEAQLEFGYRSGAEGRWGIVGGIECLMGGINLRNQLEVGMIDMKDGFPPYDGATWSVRVGTLPANAWGLHEVHGNVNEWARDVFWSRYVFPMREGDGLHMAPESWLRTVRGGGWGHPVKSVTSWSREDKPIGYRDQSLGLRPARSLSR